MRKVRIKLSQVLLERGLTQKDFAKMADLREATVSSIARNINDKVNYIHLAKIMDALEITDFNEILEFEGNIEG